MLPIKKIARVILLLAISVVLFLPNVLDAAASEGEKRYVLTKTVDSAIEGYSYEDRVKMMKEYYDRGIAEGTVYNYNWEIEDDRQYYHVTHRSSNIYPPYHEVTQDLTTLYTKPAGIVPKSTIKIPFSMSFKGINRDGTGSLGILQVLLFAGDDPTNLQQKSGQNYYVGDGKLELKEEFQYKLEDYEYKYICIGVYSGNFMAGGLGKWYVYELMEEPAASSAGGTGEAFASGSRIMWQPSEGLGYRLFRSSSQSDLGISVTDFYITSTSYADVNIEPNTTYYYTVKPVLEEAKPLDGIDEKLGASIATFTVITGNESYKPGSYKHFIMLKLDNPNMSVDGINQEVDPGRGTSPLTIAGRTMVPIRSIVEAMGGTVEWDGVTQKITLKARGNTVEMWMGKTDIRINGVAKKMDVAPVSRNSRTFVPVRFAAENLNCKVDWINSSKEAIIVYEE